MKRFLALLLTTTLGGISSSASAATVFLSPQDTVTTPGQLVAVDILAQGFTALAGGEIDFSYSESIVQVDGVTVDPFWNYSPSGGAKAGLNLWKKVGFDVFEKAPAGPDTTRIATIHLTTLALGTAQINLLNSSTFFSTTEELFPTFGNGATVQVVPVPAAVWLFGSGLFGLLSVARRRASGKASA